MRNKDSIPEKDKELINNAFSDKPKQAITKKVQGDILRVNKAIVDSTGFVIKNYHGKKLKHNKSVIDLDGNQYTVGVKGQLYNEIDEHLREKVGWRDSDFLN